ncbi:MAG: right-handed parallel beta-helix repeat-containing protein [Verrucomicrobiae bacterium]|nr:right-handed parallel beta-helix repeat-containing protein [Verrucomicrobiae bacterium]NNJ87628.1 hypothetical protein [Akkermansiaceae bacterium]
MDFIKKIFFASLPVLLACSAIGKQITVTDDAELKSAIAAVKPGNVIKIAPGKYRGGIYLTNIKGTPEATITIEGANLKKPPRFTGGSEAFHLSDCEYIILRNLHVSGFPGNGINIDDGGSFESPTHHIRLEHVRIENTGPNGNHDALKLSGLYDFVIKNCTFRGWGGSAIDMVGCHRGIIEGCRLTGVKGFSQSNGIQIKGGTTRITVKKCSFDRVGHRSVNLGGSTGLQFFRPGVPDYEAKDITIAGNRFIGSMAPIAWVTAHGGHVHHNTFYYPEKWVVRILQESKDPRFKPSHSGVFENNLIIFDQRVRVFANIGPSTNADSFKFRNNAWYEVRGSRKPVLPTKEILGIYQPKLTPKHLDPHVQKPIIRDARLKHIGAHGYRQ